MLQVANSTLLASSPPIGAKVWMNSESTVKSEPLMASPTGSARRSARQQISAASVSGGRACVSAANDTHDNAAKQSANKIRAIETLATTWSAPKIRKTNWRIPRSKAPQRANRSGIVSSLRNTENSMDSIPDRARGQSQKTDPKQMERAASIWKDLLPQNLYFSCD